MPLFTAAGILLALMTIAPPLPAQGPPAGTPPEVTRAQVQLSAGHVDSTIFTLGDFFRRTPSAIAGRLLLANAYRQKGDLDKALAAYALVRQPRTARLQAVFAVAAIQAGPTASMRRSTPCASSSRQGPSTWISSRPRRALRSCAGTRALRR